MHLKSRAIRGNCRRMIASHVSERDSRRLACRCFLSPIVFHVRDSAIRLHNMHSKAGSTIPTRCATKPRMTSPLASRPAI